MVAERSRRKRFGLADAERLRRERDCGLVERFSDRF